MVLLAGAAATAALAALARWGLEAALEPRAHRLDPWRRRWFEPERELGLLVESLLVCAFLSAFVQAGGAPAWLVATLGALGLLRLPAELWTWSRIRLHPQSTLALHQRGFFLVGAGPLWARASAAGLGAVVYFLAPFLREAVEPPLLTCLTRVLR